MGWCFSQSWATRDDMLAYLTRPERFAPRCELVKSSPRGNNHWYVARYVDTGMLWIGLDLMKGGTRRDPGWGYKDLDESVGPAEVNCPLSLLKLAQPAPTEGYAAEWRKSVEAYWAAKKARPEPAPGQVVEYGGTLYVLREKLARRGMGWDVESLAKTSNGYVTTLSFRMKAHQLRAARVVSDVVFNQWI